MNYGNITTETIYNTVVEWKIWCRKFLINKLKKIHTNSRKRKGSFSIWDNGNYNIWRMRCTLQVHHNYFTINSLQQCHREADTCMHTLMNTHIHTHTETACIITLRAVVFCGPQERLMFVVLCVRQGQVFKVTKSVSAFSSALGDPNLEMG